MLKARNLRKAFDSDGGNVLAIDDISFDVAEGEFFTLLGPSGCGKSTTMRCIAGLESLDSGEIELAGEIVSSASVFVPANRRPIGMVFQSYAIWPHMTVLQNTTFPLAYRESRLPRRERRERGLEALRLVQLEHLADRPAPYLSGGQQQRVALARSLVTHPSLLLLDEPLSNLDAKLREEMRFEIKELTSRLGITTVYVTHDQAEALSMSDRIAVMSAGRIVQLASPKELYVDPVSAEVARIVGTANVLAGTVVSNDGRWCEVKIRDRSATLTCKAPPEVELDGDVEVIIRPQSIDVLPADVAGTDDEGVDGEPVNLFGGRVTRLGFAGEHLDCFCETDVGPLRLKLPADDRASAGDQVTVRVAAGDCAVSPAPARLAGGV